MDSEDLKQYYKDIRVAHRETDRGCALVMAENLNNALRGLIETSLVPMSKIKNDRVWRPLGNLITRINLAFGLGLLADNERYDLDIIREIRNEFAHTSAHIDFENPVVQQLCSKFKMYTKHVHDNNTPDSPRGRFMIISASLKILIEHRARSKTVRPTTPPDSKVA